VDTNALLDIARRYEQLSFELGDAGVEIIAALNALDSAMPTEGFVLERVGDIVRQCDTLKDELDGARVKIRYAARRYEESDKHLRRLSKECAQNFGGGREG
jgi:hypothetical protein